MDWPKSQLAIEHKSNDTGGRKQTDMSRRVKEGTLRNALNTRKSVKPRVKAQDLLDAMLFHNGEVYGIAGGKMTVSLHNLLGPLHRCPIVRQHLINDAEQRIECRLDGVGPVDSGIAVQDFLQHLGIRYQPLALAHQFLKQSLGIALMEVRSAD
jgi:hypothetical protein